MSGYCETKLIGKESRLTGSLPLLNALLPWPPKPQPCYCLSGSATSALFTSHFSHRTCARMALRLYCYSAQLLPALAKCPLQHLVVVADSIECHCKGSFTGYCQCSTDFLLPVSRWHCLGQLCSRCGPAAQLRLSPGAVDLRVCVSPPPPPGTSHCSL